MVITATYGNPSARYSVGTMPTAIFSGSSSLFDQRTALRGRSESIIFFNGGAPVIVQQNPVVSESPVSHHRCARSGTQPYAVPPTGSAQYKTLRRFLHDESRTVQVRLKRRAVFRSSLPDSSRLPAYRRSEASLQRGLEAPRCTGISSPNRPQVDPQPAAHQIGQFPRRIIYPPSVEIRSFAVVPVQYLSENRIRRVLQKAWQTPPDPPRSFVLPRQVGCRRIAVAIPHSRQVRIIALLPTIAELFGNPAATLRKRASQMSPP